MTPEVLAATRLPGAWVDSPLLAVGAGLLLLACLVRSVRRRPRGRWVLASVVAAVVVAATTANALTGYVPTAQAARFLVTGDLPGGRVVSFRLGAPDLDVAATTVHVQLPRGYAEHPDRRYPVVVLLPGSPGRSTDWFAAGGAARTVDALTDARLLPPVLVVTPDMDPDLLGAGSDTECLDLPGGPQWETYLYRDLVPGVDRRFRTLARPSSRLLGGESAGGFCALDQGLRHRDVWGPLLALEPFGDPGPAVRGELSAAAFAAASPARYLPTVVVPAPVPVFLGTGTGAPERAGTDELARLVAARGWPLERRDVPGGHTWTTARELLPYGLTFAGRYLDAG
ncbi:alpha/beta hydrolase-fold protein [Kineococcus endophyticus]|uniref:Alpha/beta hydrolase-fold protein n=1 Tax=Kineococcus endophyticus TaxID=1181883 RepID=A0ABV3P3J2_9ACTN